MESFHRNAGVKNWLEAIGLSKNEDALIDPSVQTIRMGLGWDKGADLDASVALFDDQRKVVDTVWYEKLRSTCGSVQHSGNNKTGVGSGDDEIISVKLPDLPPNVHYLVFTVCVRTYPLSFDQIGKAYVRMLYQSEDRRTNSEVCRLSLTNRSGHSMVMGVVTRKGAYWNFRQLGTLATGRTIQQLLQDPENFRFLNDLPSFSPEMHHVTVQVIQGSNLAVKNTSIFPSSSSSSPYFVITFRNKKYISDHIPRTLDPKWESRPFDMGWINEAEMNTIEVQLFHRNTIWADSFMGMIKIPAYDLYRLGMGAHEFWFDLGSSEEKAYRSEAVSGKVLIQFRIETSLQDCSQSHDPPVYPRIESDSTGLHGVEGQEFQKIALQPQDFWAPTDVKKSEGEAFWGYADLNTEPLHEPLAVPGEKPVPWYTNSEQYTADTNSEQYTADKIPDTVVTQSGMFLGNTNTQATHETEINEEVSFAPTHQEEHQMETDINVEEQMEVENRQTTSDEEDSFSSAELWAPDVPFGSRDRLLAAIRALKPGQDFADDYTIIKRDFTGKPCLCLAKQKIGKRESVVLKFYWEEATLENTIEMHSKIARSEYVCRILGTLKTSRTGHPPCIAFEKGTRTLSDWLRSDHEMFERTWCLQQILSGLRDLHERDIVHCDVKPSNVVFFAESVAWKIIDLDGARKAGQSRVSCFTAPYAAPEVLREWPGGDYPVAQPSVDMWSCGILAYEVLTGVQMFEGDWTQDDICEFVLDGRVEEKLSTIENDCHRETISKFLKLDPAERWSAIDALQNTVFQSDAQTTMTQV